MTKEFLCKNCKVEAESGKGNYWIQDHIIDGEKVGVCKHMMVELNIESVGEKLHKLNKIKARKET